MHPPPRSLNSNINANYFYNSQTSEQQIDDNPYSPNNESYGDEDIIYP